MRPSILALTAIPLAPAAPNHFPSVIFPWKNDTCDLSRVAQPNSTLPVPSAGLNLVLIAFGHGTQNYTCTDSTAVSIPISIGAVAQLYNISCQIFSGDKVSVQAIAQSGKSIGSHVFFDETTPAQEFDVTTIGKTLAKKVAADSITSGAINVPWLKLHAETQGTTSKIKEIYRLNTNSGFAPTNCEGQQSVIAVEYTAQYWFYASS